MLVKGKTEKRPGPIHKDKKMKNARQWQLKKECHQKNEENVMVDLTHRRSQGLQWVHLHPQGGEKKIRRNLQEKFVSAPPAHHVHHHEEQFRTFFCWAVKIWRFI